MDQKFFDVAFAAAGDQTPIPDTVQSTGAVSFPQGWGFDYQRDQDTDPAAKPIDRGTMNYLMYAITQALQQYQTNGAPEFITPANNNGNPYPYAKHARVRYSATVPGVVFDTYVSTVDGNTAVPGASANWQLEADIIASSAEATAGTNARNIMTPLTVAQQDALRALLAGNAAQVFNVATATAASHALNRDTADARYANFGALSVAVASNAATATFVPPGPMPFRNPTLANGTPVVTNTAPAPLTIPAGATLGTTGTVLQRVIFLMMYNGGSPVLAVINAAASVNLDETGLITTNAISSSSNSSNAAYSAAAIVNSPYRVVGFMDFTEAVAGTWATAPSTVQSAGGNSLSALAGLGYGQVWQTVTRANNVVYYNTTGKPIMVCAYATSSSDGNLVATVNSVIVALSGTIGASGQGFGINFIVQPGVRYVLTVSGGASLTYTAELR